MKAKLYSRHESHRDLKLSSYGKQWIVNFGNRSELNGMNGRYINSPSAVAMNVDKREMKAVFVKQRISTPKYIYGVRYDSLRLPVIVKGSSKLTLTEYKVLNHDSLVEEYLHIEKEYRLHVSILGLFYAVEKIPRKENAGQIRKLSTCKFVEVNEKPAWFNVAVKQCKSYLKYVGLDFGAFDIIEHCGWFYILECNTAPGMGDKTRQMYSKEIDQLITYKTNKLKYYYDKAIKTIKKILRYGSHKPMRGASAKG